MLTLPTTMDIVVESFKSTVYGLNGFGVYSQICFLSKCHTKGNNTIKILSIKNSHFLKYLFNLGYLGTSHILKDNLGYLCPLFL